MPLLPEVVQKHAANFIGGMHRQNVPILKLGQWVSAFSGRNPGRPDMEDGRNILVFRVFYGGARGWAFDDLDAAP